MSSSFYSSSGSDSAVYQSAQDSADNAQTSAAEAAASLTEFKNLYMGSFQTAPTALQDGSLYYNENTNLLYYWNGTAWTATNTSVATTDDIVEGTTNLFVTDERIDDRVDSLLTAGSNIALTYDDAANTLTIASTASGGLTDLSGSDTDDLTEGSTNLYHTDERVDDRVNSLLTAGSNITLNYDDAANTLTIASTASGGGGGIALTDISVNSNSVGTADLTYNSSTGIFDYTPPDLSSYATTSSLSSYATTASLATVATSGAYSDLTGTPSLSGYLTAITGESLSDLSDVSPATPTDGQVLTWDNSTSLWQPTAPSSTGGGGGIYVGVNSTGTGVTTSGTDSIAMGKQASATAARSIAIGRLSYVSHDDSVALGGGTSSATRQLTLGAVNNTQGFTSIRVGNTSYTPTVSMDLTTKSYVDTAVANAGGGGGSSSHPNIVTGTYTTTSTSFVDAGEIVDTDDGFTGAFQVLVHAVIGTGSQASVWYGQLQVAYNPHASTTNWMTQPWFGNGFTFTSASVANIRIQPRIDTSTNKIYLQVKNGSSTSTVYKWTATLI